MDFSMHKKAPSTEILIHRFNSRAKYGISIRAKIIIHRNTSLSVHIKSEIRTGSVDWVMKEKKMEKRVLFYLL